ncbi:hypothetical protein CspHIS471_0603390 [Cutaneotrichosporon sp. HIS471]|nr:hypothetical protein CspHIS471_0603390 [Cutaneotrichosporon sp. HIS471]
MTIYFTVVDPEGRFKNLRFRDRADLRNVECFMREFGPNLDQKHRYPGHPELEVAVLHLCERTQDPVYLAFARYLLSARGQAREDQNGLTYFQYEAGVREDPVHSVRALYLLTGAADAGGELQSAERRLFDVSVRDKMYVTAGFGSSEYAADIKCSLPAEAEDRFLRASAPGKVEVAFSFTMPVRLVAPHLVTRQDTLTVTRGPIVYVAESVDNAALDKAHPHFEGVGLYPTARFTEKQIEIEGVSIIALASQPGDAAVLKQYATDTPYRVVEGAHPTRIWEKIADPVTFVPWFARANRGGARRIRTSFLRTSSLVGPQKVRLTSACTTDITT